MVAYKCKLCGGTLLPNPDGQTGKCEYCKNILTLPKEKDDKLQNVLNRANDFRMVCDFDRAIYEYEKALEIAENEPETHWGLMLSRYGVEYVKDPQSFMFKPTLHRISSISVLEDPDYLAAVKYASPANAYSYKKDAEEIETTMRKLLQISASQEPYDIFISYKKEENGVRTPDSYFAHDLYNKLTGAGYKVFFAQETLKLSAGEEYEPKIYSAIISAKVMIVIGTKEEYFNAVWVKNEWSRFSELIEHGEDKTIIPVFDNFDIGKLPNRLSKYQALQKSDLDFLNVLMQTVEKLVDNRKSKINFDKDISTEKIALERGFLALEDGQFSNADVFFEKALNANPHSSEAYFGKLMVELKARKQEDVILADKPLNTYRNFEKAVRFADQQLKVDLLKYEEKVSDNLKNKYYQGLINDFLRFKISNGEHSDVLIRERSDVLSLEREFLDLGDYKESLYYAKQCRERKYQIDALIQNNISKKEEKIREIERIISTSNLELENNKKSSSSKQLLKKEKITKFGKVFYSCSYVIPIAFGVGTLIACFVGGDILAGIVGGPLAGLIAFGVFKLLAILYTFLIELPISRSREKNNEKLEAEIQLIENNNSSILKQQDKMITEKKHLEAECQQLKDVLQTE